MLEYDGLKFNLIKKFRSYNIPSKMYEDAIKYAEVNAKKERLTLMSCATEYIETNILINAKTDDNYRKIIESIYDNEARSFSYKNNVPLKKVEEEKENIINIILSKDNSKNKSSILMIIRKNMEKHLLKYQIESKKEVKWAYVGNQEEYHSSVSKTDEPIIDENMKFLTKFYNMSELSKITGISIYNLSNYLLTGRRMDNKTKEKILQCFSVNSIEELYKKLKEEKKNTKKEEIKVSDDNVNNEEKKIKKVTKPRNNTSTNGKNYNISFLKEYFEKTDNSKYDFAKAMKVKIGTVNNWLDGDLLKEKYLERLLQYFNKKSLAELISEVRRELNDILISELKSDSKIEKEEVVKVKDKKIYDISFFEEYIKTKNITKILLSNILDISLPTLNRMLNGETKLTFEKLEKLLNYFEVENYEDLKNKIIEESKEVIKLKTKQRAKDKKIYDISFFEEYIKTKHITKTSLENILDISLITLNKMLSGERKLTKEELEKLLNYFKVNNYEELKNKIQEESKQEEKTKEDKKIYDISFFEEYIKTKHITKTSLVNILDISYITLYKMLKGETKLTSEKLEKLLNYFKVNDYEDLKNKIQEESKQEIKPKEDKKRIYDISFFEKYIETKHITKASLIGILNISFNSLYKILSGERKLKEEELQKLLNYFKVNNYEELKDKIQQDSINQLKVYENINFQTIKEYMMIKGITPSKLSRELDIYLNTVYKWLNGICKPTLENLNKILEYLEVEDYNELENKVKEYKESHDGKIEKVILETIDFTPIREYLIIKGLTYYDIADHFNNNYMTVSNWFNNKNRISDNNLKKLLNFLECESLEQLKHELETFKKENNGILVPKERLEKQSIIFKYIEEYIYVKKITREQLSSSFGIATSTLRSWFNNKNVVSEQKINKLIKHLGFEKIEDLIKELESYKQEFTDERLLAVQEQKLNYIQEYMDIKNISKRNLAKELEVSEATLYNWFSNRVIITDEKIFDLLSHLGFNTLEDLIEKIESYKENNKGILKQDNNYDVTCIKEYIEIKNITKIELSNKIGVNTATLHKWFSGITNPSDENLEKMLHALGFETLNQIKDEVDKYKNKKIIDPEKLLKILKQYEFSEKEHKVILLLFGLYNDKCYTIREVQKIVEISENEIFRICKKTLELYMKENDEIKENNNTEINYIKEYIKLKGIPQSELVRKLNVDRNVLYKWFSGMKAPTSDKIKKILEILEFENLDQLKQEVEDYRNRQMIDSHKLLQMLEQYEFSQTVCKVILLLFGLYDKKYYSINDVQKITGLNEKEIFTIYKNCLELYKKLYISGEDIIKRILK